MEAIQRLKFGDSREDDELPVRIFKPVEMIFTEAVLHIQRNITAKIIHQEITNNNTDENGWLKKDKKLYNDVTLKVVVRIPINE